MCVYTWQPKMKLSSAEYETRKEINKMEWEVVEQLSNTYTGGEGGEMRNGKKFISQSKN